MASTLTISGAESSGTLPGLTLPGTRRSAAAADGRELTASGTLTQLTVAGLSAGRSDTVRPAPGDESGALCSTLLTREPRAESREPRAESREPRAESREPRAESREPRAESREPRVYTPEAHRASAEPMQVTPTA